MTERSRFVDEAIGLVFETPDGGTIRTVRGPNGEIVTYDSGPADEPGFLTAAAGEPAEPSELEPQPGEHFHAIGNVQGVSTGRRTFTNSTWRQPPFAFHWQRSSSAHGGTPEVVQTGLVTRVVEDGPEIHMFGPFDLGSDVGREYARQVVSGFARWVSIGLDEQPVKITYIWPDGVEPATPMDQLTAQPEQVILDGGRIGELTGTSMPAQADATIEPTPELIELMGDEIDEAAAARPPVARANPREVSNVQTATARAAAALRRQPASNLADAVEALTAAAYRIEIPDLPPPEWFDEPTDMPMEGALNVDDNGRVWGLLAPLHVNHRAYARSGGRQEVPFGNVDYGRFNGGAALTTAGKVSAGPLTMDCGHAPRFRPDGQAGPEHYENSCSVVGAVRAGESRSLGGVWIAGALLPGVGVDQVARMLACRCSGDWQPHGDKVGWSELIACLLVPSPGFATARAAASYDGEGVLVASSVPVRPAPTAGRPALADVIDHMADAAGATPAARIADIVQSLEVGDGITREG